MAGVADVRGLPPYEFTDAGKFSDQTIGYYLAEAALHIEADAYPNRYHTLHALLAAHLIKDGQSAGGVSGRVVSEKIGPAARTYAAPAGLSAGDDIMNLTGTSYGRRFLALSEKSAAVGMISLYDGVTGNPDA